MYILSPIKAINLRLGGFWGDFQVHSSFSDGSVLLNGLMEAAKIAGMDFIAIADHNTTEHFRELIPFSTF